MNITQKFNIQVFRLSTWRPLENFDHSRQNERMVIKIHKKLLLCTYSYTS